MAKLHNFTHKGNNTEIIWIQKIIVMQENNQQIEKNLAGNDLKVRGGGGGGVKAVRINEMWGLEMMSEMYPFWKCEWWKKIFTLRHKKNSIPPALYEQRKNNPD